MAITARLLCVPTVVIIFTALILSFLTSLSLPIIPAFPIVQTTLDNGTFVVNGTNSQTFQELKVRFLFFPYLISCCSSFSTSLFQFGIWWDVPSIRSENLENSNTVYLQDCMLLWSRCKSDMPSQDTGYVVRLLLIVLGLTRAKDDPYNVTVVLTNDTSVLANDTSTATVLQSTFRHGLAFEPVGKFLLYENYYLLKDRTDWYLYI